MPAVTWKVADGTVPKSVQAPGIWFSEPRSPVYTATNGWVPVLLGNALTIPSAGAV